LSHSVSLCLFISKNLMEKSHPLLEKEKTTQFLERVMVSLSVSFLTECLFNKY
jgi:hypothetical protein